MIDYLIRTEILYIPLLYWLLFAWLVWLIAEQRRLNSMQGPMKRGVLVWEEDLGPEMESYLRRIKGNVVSGPSFIRVEGDQVLIRTPSPFLFNSWPYLGFIDFAEENPRLQYRASLPALLTLAVAATQVVVIPLVLAFVFINHRMEKRAIREFLEEQAEERRGLR